MLTLAIGGCAGAAGTDGTAQPQRSAGPLTVHASWESCEAAGAKAETALGGSQDALSLPRLDDGFQPVAAVVCRTAVGKRPSGGSDEVAAEDRADDVAALVAALRLPDEKPTTGACTMDLVLAPWLALVDAQGRWVRPGVPVDACGKPRAEFRAAYEQLRTKRVTTRVLREVESDAAAASGCSQTWADMVWVAGQLGGGGDHEPGALAADNPEVRVCVYHVPASEQGSGKPGGTFQSGGKLPAERWTAIKRHLTTAAPASSCSTPASRFAVLRQAGGLIYVEGDGCRRVLIEGGSGMGSLRQGTADLIAVLFDR